VLDGTVFDCGEGVGPARNGHRGDNGHDEFHTRYAFDHQLSLNARGASIGGIYVLPFLEIGRRGAAEDRSLSPRRLILLRDGVVARSVRESAPPEDGFHQVSSCSTK